jgi:hypothetical protein
MSGRAQGPSPRPTQQRRQQRHDPLRLSPSRFNASRVAWLVTCEYTSIVIEKSGLDGR